MDKDTSITAHASFAAAQLVRGFSQDLRDNAAERVAFMTGSLMNAAAMIFQDLELSRSTYDDTCAYAWKWVQENRRKMPGHGMTS